MFNTIFLLNQYEFMGQVQPGIVEEHCNAHPRYLCVLIKRMPACLLVGSTHIAPADLESWAQVHPLQL